MKFHYNPLDLDYNTSTKFHNLCPEGIKMQAEKSWTHTQSDKQTDRLSDKVLEDHPLWMVEE